MFKRIVVLLDGSPLAETALPYAIEIARRFEAAILLIQNLDTVFPNVPKTTDQVNQPETKLGLLIREAHEQDQHIRDAADQYLKSKVEEVEASGVKGSYNLLIRAPFDSMMEFCQKADVDLIVMTTH
ncbi:MAG: universal stress protein, partial [Deltaproteobacteria bacterium]|nr:universal stress protein [Deltaproteobacteria bacterium]